ncbi:peptide chain release factor 1 [Ruminococcaceae bacterium OttesenSCG-928-O06]|nr:peptide chain release factor 1 [Ruminococcaceae bacterium OttesenSCG-928-O06]
MFDKLDAVRSRYEEINQRLQDPTVVSDPAKYRDLMKEYKYLGPLVETYEAYKKAQNAMEEAKQLLEEGGQDAELKELAREELEENKARAEELAEQLKVLLLPRDENDERSVILEIRGGTGGDEAALFAADLYRMYAMYAEKRGWKAEILNVSETELGGMKEVEFSLQGDSAYSRMKFEAGTHRVQRVPETETQGRIHTSAVTVAVMPEADEVDVDINPADLKIDTFRASGAGGQHVNKTSSAIRITHLPTGTVVECQDERSQHKNKDKALRVLRSRLLAEKQQAQKSEIDAARRSQVGSGDRSERIRTYNYPQGRVTDHRINLTLYKLDAILQGDLDDLIDPLIAADQAEKLRAVSEG